MQANTPPHCTAIIFCETGRGEDPRRGFDLTGVKHHIAVDSFPAEIEEFLLFIAFDVFPADETYTLKVSFASQLHPENELCSIEMPMDKQLFGGPRYEFLQLNGLKVSASGYYIASVYIDDYSVGEARLLVCSHGEAHPKISPPEFYD